jgi:hypothetical protein
LEVGAGGRKQPVGALPDGEAPSSFHGRIGEGRRGRVLQGGKENQNQGIEVEVERERERGKKKLRRRKERDLKEKYPKIFTPQHVVGTSEVYRPFNP